jgi:hypothetical protein
MNSEQIIEATVNPIATVTATDENIKSVDISLTQDTIVNDNSYINLVNKPTLNNLELSGNTTLSLVLNSENNTHSIQLKQNDLVLSNITGENILNLSVGSSNIKNYIDNKIQTVDKIEDIDINSKNNDYIFIKR